MNKTITFKPDVGAKNVFVLGMFRSGTSLTCKLLKHFGLNFGHEFRMLKGKGKFKDLNPDGFSEDFLFAQLSRYWYKQLKATGDNPPNINQTESFITSPIKLSDFIAFSEFHAKEDRLSFFHRVLCYLLVYFKTDRAFLSKKQAFVKIPMLTPFYKQLKTWMPNTSFLVIIRNPDSTIKSSKILTSNSDINLFNAYYEHLYHLANTYTSNVNIFSYDNLLALPKESLKSLAFVYKKTVNFDAEKTIKRDLIRNNKTEHLENSYYDELYKKCINPIN